MMKTKKICFFIIACLLVTMISSCTPGDSTSNNESNESGTGTSLPEVSNAVSEESTEPPILTELEMEPHPMTVTITSDIKFVMNTTLSNGSTMSLCWDKKDWGTWNIGSYKVDSIDYTSNSTDWEYVFRASDTDSAGSTWSGGNHGNETLVSLKLYDGETGDELPFVKNSIYNCNIFKVVEETRLHTGNADSPYAEVTRTYTVAGKLVTLHCTFDFIKDAYFNMSYITMFPISKAQGYKTVFNHLDGTTFTYESDYYLKNPTAANFTGYYEAGHEAMSCDIYPRRESDRYFHIEIYNKKDMTDDFSNTQKTFLWDMSANQNKLYFSIFNMESKTKVEASTHWDTLASWEIIFEG